MVGPQFQAKGVRLHVAPVPPDTWIHADREKVQQVMLNLLSNALKFTEPAGEVAMSCAVDGRAVTLAVRDTGIGIAPDRLVDIFEPFVQVDASLTRRAGGAGLGLAISRNLSTAMGGTLSVESALGGGSCFVVSLPRADAAADDAPRLDAVVPGRATAAAD
jgi:signal transduction histidine kinase